MNELHGYTALVTGADGRLGPIWCDALVAAGARVIGVDVDQYDLRNAAQISRLIADYANDVDILVNNAGLDSRPNLSTDALDLLKVNVLAPQILTAEFGASMANRGTGGVIVNIASLYGLVAPDLRYYNHRTDGWVKDSLYGASKAALIQLTRDYAARLGPHGVRVNAIAPGGVVAGGDALTKSDPEFAVKYTARIPLGRMATPEDLGGVLVFLATAASNFINGQTLVVDGGYLCW